MNKNYFLEHLTHSSFKIHTYSNTYSSLEIKNHLTIIKEQLSPLKKEEYVGVYLPFGMDYFLSVFALWEMGVTPVLLTTKSPLEEVRQLAKEVPFNTIIGNGFEFLRVGFHNNILRDEDEALVFFTSGSTSRPKGVVHTYDSLFYSAMGSVEFYHYNIHDRFLLTLPPNHVGGFMICLRALLAKGTFMIGEGNIHNQIIDLSPTTLSFVPTQLQTLIESGTNLLHMKSILLGGAPIPMELLHTADQMNLPISPTYGSTEAGSQVSAIRPHDKLESKYLGEVLPYREISLSQEGTILLRGKNLFKAYYVDGQKVAPLNTQGCFETSDVARIENEKYYIEGRNDLTFISGGENINPTEVETALLNHPDLSEAYVVPVPDPKFGKIAVCFYRGKSQNYGEWLREYLPSYKIPKKYFYLDDDNMKQSRALLSEFALKLMKHDIK